MMSPRQYRRFAAVVTALMMMVVTAIFLAATADAHENWVTVHNGNDAGTVASGHDTLVACDGTNNGHSFAVQGRTASGKIRTQFDPGASSACTSWNPGDVGDFVKLRWACHGNYGAWKDA